MEKKQWSSLKDLDKKLPKNREFATDNFNEISSVDRRNFLKMAGVGVIGAGLVGCDSIRRPKQHIEPYSDMPEHLVPGEKLHFATSYAIGEKVSGLLVESHEGRPTKVDGNPKHADNFGASGIFDQASVLDLYDPDRIKEITASGKKSDFQSFFAYFNEKLQATDKKVAVVVNHQSSPIFYSLVENFSKKYNVEFYRYDAINSENVTFALKDILGKYAYPKVDYTKADKIVSLDSDFLSDDLNELTNARDFFSRRDPDEKMNRLYQFESTYSVTGGKADHRYMVGQDDFKIICLHFLYEIYRRFSKASRISAKYISEIKTYLDTTKDISNKINIGSIVDDLLDKGVKSVFVAGKAQSPVVHKLVFYINEILSLENEDRVLSLDNKSKVISYIEATFSAGFLKKDSISSISALNDGIVAGKFSCLLDLGVNLFYNAPSDLPIQKEIKKNNVDLVALSLLPSDTTASADWVLPMSHYLEQWDVLKSISGVESVVQPLVSSLYKDSLSINDFLSRFIDQKKDDYSLLKKKYFSTNSKWKIALASGIFSSQKKRPIQFDVKSTLENIVRNVPFRKYFVNSESRQTSTIQFIGNSFCYDGRFANNSWLQELPHPITRLTWDNAFLISNDYAKKNKLKNYDVVELKTDEGLELNAPVWVLPGQHENTISITLGYGQKNVGKIAEGAGFSCEKIRTTKSFHSAKVSSLKKTGKKYILASVQDHWLIEDKIFEGKASSNSQNNRPIHRHADLETYKKNKSFAKDQEIVPQFPQGGEGNKHAMYADDMSVFNERKYDEGYQWGMAIDLGKCSGCGTCIVACQAENNIPVVGKEQVLKGREMHWIRLDRYFEGDPRDPKVLQQPMTCLQCEQAPCEQVCPVAATVHSKEGLNDMVYNRCIGTRFCANNCPVKVRRYNFFDYHQKSPHAQKKVRKHLFDLVKEPPETIQMQFNPDVTVRMRGVMEKCTYCVQRINKKRIEKKNQDEKIKDGDIVTACEQVCPSGAVVFGDINDKKSRVSVLKAKERDYHIFGGLNLKARTSYLAEVKNLNPNL